MDFGKQLSLVRERAPLVQCITNFVTVNDCANIVLAAGGSPSMADDVREAAEAVQGAAALVCNLGAIAAVNAMLAGWADLTEKYHCSLANLCVKWNSMVSGRINVLCGARKLSQIEDNARSLDVSLSREDFQRMKADADRCIREREARL